MVSDLTAFLRWYLVLALIAWISLPVACKLFSRLPDRGLAFSKPFGLLFSAYLFWFLGSHRLLANDLGGILFAVLLVAAAGAILQGKSGLRALGRWVKTHARYVVAVEITFLMAFAGWAVVRAYIPDINGTEKPMEFMFINSILNSPSFPPHDAWLSGHAISYYYFGYLIISALARLTGTSSAVSFNLGLAALFALSGVAALGVVANLVAIAQSRDAAQRSPRPATLYRAFWSGLLGALMVLLVGNFYGVLEIAHNNSLWAEVELPMVWYDFGSAPDLAQAGSLDDFTSQPGIKAGMINLWQWLDLKQLNAPPAPHAANHRWELGNWFFAARVLHDRNLVGVETEAIDENPAFSFLLGDMHPHVLALPFVMLAIGLACQWLLWSRAAGTGYLHNENLRLPFTFLLFSGLVLGSLAFLNTWDFPIYWLLTLLAIGLGFCCSAGWRAFIKNWRYFTALAASLLFLSGGLYYPFYLTFQSQAGGLLPNLIYPSRFQQVVVMFAPLLAGVSLFVIWLRARWKGLTDRRVAWGVGIGLVVAVGLFIAGTVFLIYSSPGRLDQVGQFIYPLDERQALSLLWQRRLVDSLAVVVPAAIVGILAGWLVGAIRRSAPPVELQPFPGGAAQTPEAGVEHSSEQPGVHWGNPAVWMTVLMVLAGALLLLLPEFIYLRDNFGTRMNTVFKFYFQVWVLWGLATALTMWLILQSSQRWLKAGMACLMGFTITAGLVYTAGTLFTRSAGFTGSPTLDGMAYFNQAYADDAAAIAWLVQNASPSITGQPILLEGTRGAYWAEGPSSRISMASGIPTVLGWVNHEAQWRGSYFSQVAGREADIRTVYQTRDWDTAQAILDRYGVEYVVVSPLERGWYPGLYTPKFDQHMRRVFQSGEVVIYQR